VADLVRNPRRTLSTMVGVVLGVGLFCGVLFFVDGLSASMTHRAVAPLAIDMQRIVSQRAGANLQLTQTSSVDAAGAAGRAAGDGEVEVVLELHHGGETAANEVAVRSRPGPSLEYVEGSAEVDGRTIPDADGNPFAQGPARAGYNLGTVEPGATHRLSYRLRATAGGAVDGDPAAVATSSISSRESVSPVAANQPAATGLDELATRVAEIPGVASAAPLSIADLGTGTLHRDGITASGPVKIFGFDAGYADRDTTIVLVEGALGGRGAVISAEAGRALGAGIGDLITVDLPDGSTAELEVTGVADLSRARSLFSSRRGGDLETFIYVPNSVIVSPDGFAATVFPAFERAAAAGTGRLKSPPIRELDIALDRNLLDADPTTAATQTERIASEVMAVAEHQDYLLDNISNTLHVAADDAGVAKRLFVFLGVPGALLAATLAAYAGNVLAEAQRREQATLRIRGASRRHLMQMLAARTALLTAAGALIGLSTGYLAAVAILGRASLERASAGSLAASAVIGTLGGFVATGTALFLTGWRSIDREINEDRARLATRSPLWRRARLDLIGLAVLVGGTAWALWANAFDGAPGSVYFGRSVELNLALLVLPVAVWLTGALVAARVIGLTLRRTRPRSTPLVTSAGTALFRRSIGRRPWAIGNGAIVASLIVALATSLAVFTASYDQAKTADARYANGADIRITPSPIAERTYGADDGGAFETQSIAATTPVVYGLSNVVLRSDRTSDPANLTAIDPVGYTQVAPVDPVVGDEIRSLDGGGDTILLSEGMADFLQVEVGDTLHVLLARATPEQVEIGVEVTGLYERLPGFPDGADAVIDIDLHTAAVPSKAPDFFLASTTASDDGTLEEAVAEIRRGPAAADALQIDTRASTLDRDQSSLAALNVAGLVDLDSGFALAMAAVTIAIFVFGLLLQRRREYVTLRAQGLAPATIRVLIAAEAATVAVTGIVAGLAVGAAMGYYFVAVLRPLFVLDPRYVVPAAALLPPVLLILGATAVSATLGSRLVNTLQPTELLRDE
jgi:putative ABC transport system permease protein